MLQITNTLTNEIVKQFAYDGRTTIAVSFSTDNQDDNIFNLQHYTLRWIPNSVTLLLWVKDPSHLKDGYLVKFVLHNKR